MHIARKSWLHGLVCLTVMLDRKKELKSISCLSTMEGFWHSILIFRTQSGVEVRKWFLKLEFQFCPCIASGRVKSLFQTMLIYTLIDLPEIHQENSELMLEISKNLAATDSQISLFLIKSPHRKSKTRDSSQLHLIPPSISLHCFIFTPFFWSISPLLSFLDIVSTQIQSKSNLNTNCKNHSSNMDLLLTIQNKLHQIGIYLDYFYKIQLNWRCY